MPEVQTSLDKSLSLMTRVLEERYFPSLSALAKTVALPLSTTHRLLAGLERAGFIAQLGRNRYVSGPALRQLAKLEVSTNQMLAEVSRPILSALSRRTRRITHLGILEDNMMTYLVKEGDPEGSAISRPDMQLEAYCTGLGKALLAHLPKGKREIYLSTAPFIALTPSTITSADALREEFALTRKRGYALDNGEMFDGLTCIAVPVRVGDRVVAATSLVVAQKAEPCRPVSYLARLHAAVSQIESRLVAVRDMFAPMP